jgi:cell division protein FtsI (penicillin-binding protein 3)
MALDTGKVTLSSVFDATSPIRIDRFTINDDHPQRRPLTVPELFKFSSNIASAKMAVAMGIETQRAFFDKIGFLKPLNFQLTEIGAPLYPRHWMTINTMTIAFGHGISVTPLHLAIGSAAVVNGGVLYSPTLVKRTPGSDPGKRIIQPKTSVMMRQLLRLNVQEGTGTKAEVPGYQVGGKTGTAEKPSRGGYRQKALISTFAGMFPMNDPKFVVVVSLDEPKGIAETGGYATGGMVAAPSVKTIIENIVSLYGILPGDLKEGLPPIEIASTPLPAPVQPPQFISARHRGGQEQRKALPVRPGPNQTAAAPATGVGRVAAE